MVNFGLGGRISGWVVLVRTNPSATLRTFRVVWTRPSISAGLLESKTASEALESVPLSPFSLGRQDANNYRLPIESLSYLRCNFFILGRFASEQIIVATVKMRLNLVESSELHPPPFSSAFRVQIFFLGVLFSNFGLPSPLLDRTSPHFGSTLGQSWTPLWLTYVQPRLQGKLSLSRMRRMSPWPT